MRLEKAFIISVVSLLVIGLSLAIAHAEALQVSSPQVWAGWVTPAKIPRHAAPYMLFVSTSVE
jgi:hypothetical protein